MKSKHYDKIYKFSLDWVSKRMKPFIVNDLRLAYIRAGNSPPDTDMIYGRIFQELSKEGFIIHHGYRNIITKRGKKGVVAVWISLEYSKKQQSNATKDTKTLTINFE